MAASTIFTGGTSSTVTTTALYLLPGGSLSNSGSEVFRQAIIAESGTLSNIRCYVSANSSGATGSLNLRVNTANAANQSASIGAGTTGEFIDTGTAQSVTAGNLISQRTAGVASGSITFERLAIDYIPTDTTKTVGVHGHNYGSSFTTASTTRYWALSGASSIQTTEATAQIQMRYSGTASHFHCRVSANSRTTTTTTRLRKNAGDSAISASIGSTATGSFDDTSNTESFVSGDEINYSFTTGTGTQAITFQCWTINCTSTSGHYAFSTGNGLTFNTASNSSICPLNGQQATDTFANQAQKFKRSTFLSELALYLISNARSTSTTVATYDNSADTALSVSIGSGVSGQLVDSTNVDTVAADDQRALRVTTGSGAGDLVFGNTSIRASSLKEVNAELTSATGAANDSTVTTQSGTNAPAEATTASGASYNASVSFGANAELTSATVTAFTISEIISVNADVNTVTAVSQTPSSINSPSGGLDSGTGSSNSPNAAFGVQAASTSSTGASSDIGRATGAPVVTATASSDNSSPAFATSAGLCSATGAANDATKSISVNAGLCSATGTSSDSINLIQPNADITTSSGTAYDATVSTTVQHEANAEVCTSTGSAFSASISISSSIEASSLSGSAYNPTPLVAPNANVGASTGTANDISSIATTEATTSTATATAGNASPAVNPNAEAALASGISSGATTIETSSIETTSGTGSANNASISVLVYAQATSGVGASNSPTTLKRYRVMPNGDFQRGSWTTDTGGTTNIYTAIDEATRNDSDYIKDVTV
jgi:hypothetical protein